MNRILYNVIAASVHIKMKGVWKRPSLSCTLFAVMLLLACSIKAAPAPAADEAWTQVIAYLNRKVSSTERGTKRTAQQVERDRVTRAAEARQAANSAKDFYANFPTHPNAARARKLEAVFALQGVTDSDPGYEASAHATATAYRRNITNAAVDRFEVALSSELVRSRAKTRRLPGSTPRELEEIADGLRREFGDIDPVFDFYASIARHADMTTARRLAENLSSWPAPSSVKAEARSIINRHSMLNRPVNVEVTSMDGTHKGIISVVGRKTVIFVWSPAPGSNRMGILKHYRTLLAGTDVVYLAVGSSPQAASADTHDLPLPGLVYYDQRGTNLVASGLNVHAMPYIFVVGASGLLTGFGPAIDLPALVNGIH